MKKLKGGKFNKKIIIIPAIVALIIVGIVFVAKNAPDNKNSRKQKEQIEVSRRDITATITGTAVVRPQEEYSITSLVSGDVILADFEEGDIVNEGDVLYKIDASDIEKDIESANLAVERAEQNYADALKAKEETQKSNINNVESAKISQEKAKQGYSDAVDAKERNLKVNQQNLESADIAVQNAQKNYDDALKLMEDLNVKASISGTVGEVFVKEGDSVSAGMNVAYIYDNSSMEFKIPFNEDDIKNIHVGQSAQITITGSGEELLGTVDNINTASEVKNGYMKVRHITIKVNDPGALSPGDKATAKIGEIYCNDAGVGEYVNEVTVTAKSSGTVKQINVKSGNSAYAGNTIITLESENVQSQVKSAKLALDDAKINYQKALDNLNDYASDSQIENAELSMKDADVLYDKAQDALENHTPDSQIANAAIALEEARINLEKIKDAGKDYEITASSSGRVITKNIKAGDKVDTMSATQPMAVIYDMSSLKFELMIDELDINKIAIGQEVKITADALNGKEYFGTVSSVSIDGEEENGVTSYPVMVHISEFDDDLLPGMNIDAQIAVGNVKNVLAIPKSAVTRDNIVYVAGKKEDALDDAPEGYKSVKVVTGLNDGDYIEIISGLSEKDVVKIETIEDGSMFPMMGGHPGANPGGGK